MRLSLGPVTNVLINVKLSRNIEVTYTVCILCSVAMTDIHICQPWQTDAYHLSRCTVPTFLNFVYNKSFVVSVKYSLGIDMQTIHKINFFFFKYTHNKSGRRMYVDGWIMLRRAPYTWFCSLCWMTECVSPVYTYNVTHRYDTNTTCNCNIQVHNKHC